MFDGNKMKKIRVRKKMSISVLRDTLRDKGYTMANQSLYNYEANKSTPDADVLKCIAAILEVDMLAFFSKDTSLQRCSVNIKTA